MIEIKMLFFYKNDKFECQLMHIDNHEKVL